MNKTTETTKTDDTKTEAIETIQNVELDNVTGGCSRCGCGQPDAVGSPQQLAANFLRR